MVESNRLSLQSIRILRDVTGSGQRVATRHREAFAHLFRTIAERAAPSWKLYRDAVVDTAWAIASPETYDLLVATGRRTLDAYQARLATTLTAALLANGQGNVQ